jgi:hypothetical protein
MTQMPYQLQSPHSSSAQQAAQQRWAARWAIIDYF